MSKWFDGDADNAPADDAAAPAETRPDADSSSPAPNKYLTGADTPAAPAAPTVDETGDPADTPVAETTGDVAGVAVPGGVSSYLTTPDPSPAPAVNLPENKITAQASKKNAKKSAKTTPRRPRRRGGPRLSLPSLPHMPTIPKPVKIGAGIVAAVAVLGTAGALGVSYFGATDQPVTAATGSQTSLAPMPAPESTTPAPTTSNLPAPEEVVVSGDCTVNTGETTMRPTSKSLRGTVAQFYAEYAGHNAEGIGATLDDKSSMKKQNWSAVFDQIPAEASFCVRMGKDTGHSVEVQVTMTGAGVSETYEQKATGIRRDGQWKILELEGTEK
ncbi:hypothetical protein [Corynebacterium variabile]|uniref:hypothetical protein n=1 Tax=Corynebacterium variabile TaxID=1727 RepID=UPI003BB03FEF